MNNGIYNVLSIDWDYFIDATMAQRMELFPDGGNENLGMSLQNSIWSSRYMSGELVKIGIDKKALNFLKSVLSLTSPDCPMMVVDSHRHAYEFIVQSMEEDCVKHLNLVNVDFHHDVYDIGDHGRCEFTDLDIDCGNWMRFLMNDYDSSADTFSWVNRTDSDSCSIPDWCNDRLRVIPLRDIKKYEWDAIFICRSGMWSPPHLDKEFNKAFKSLAYRNCARVQTNIFESRYPEVSRMTRQIKGILEKNKLPVPGKG